MPLPTLADLKRHLNKSNTTDDAELSDILDAAVEVVEGIVGPLTSIPVTETHFGVSSDVIVLRQSPALALTSVSARTFPGSASVSYVTSDYLLDTATGVLRTASGFRFSGDVTVSYSAGRTAIPAAVSLAALIVAAHLWETQRVAGTRGNTSGPGFGQGAPDGLVPTGFLIPNRARELLEDYRRAPRVA